VTATTSFRRRNSSSISPVISNDQLTYIYLLFIPSIFIHLLIYSFFNNIQSFIVLAIVAPLHLELLIQLPHSLVYSSHTVQQELDLVHQGVYFIHVFVANFNKVAHHPSVLLDEET
jgi:hypothetical protein